MRREYVKPTKLKGNATIFYTLKCVYSLVDNDSSPLVWALHSCYTVGLIMASFKST